MFRMPFGKWKGHLLSEIPDDYLWWVITNCDNIAAELRAAIVSRLNEPPGPSTKDKPPPPGAITEDKLSHTIRTWFRSMCKRFHPDCGGSAEAMKTLNAAHEELKKYLSDLF